MKGFISTIIFILIFHFPVKAQMKDTAEEKRLHVKEMKCVGYGLKENGKQYTDTFLILNRKYNKKGLLKEELNYYSELFDVSDPPSFIGYHERKNKEVLQITTYYKYDKSLRLISKKTCDEELSKTYEEIHEFDTKGKLTLTSEIKTTLEIKRGKIEKMTYVVSYKYFYVNDSFSYVTNGFADTLRVTFSDPNKKTEKTIDKKSNWMHLSKFDLKTNLLLEDHIFKINKSDTTETRTTKIVYTNTSAGPLVEKQYIIDPAKQDTLSAELFTYNMAGLTLKLIKQNYDYEGVFHEYIQTWEYDELNRITKHSWTKDPDYSITYFSNKKEIIHYGNNLSTWKKETLLYNKFGLISERIIENQEGKLLDHFYFSYSYYK